MLKVEGPEAKLVYSGKEVDESYLGEQAPEGRDAAQRIVALKQQVQETMQQTPAIAKLSKELQIEKGKRVYLQACAMCHQMDGKGLPQVFPPLANSDYLMADKTRSIEVVLRGLSGPVTVNGHVYNGVMPPQVQLSDDQVANVLTFIRNSWGNQGDAVSEEEVNVVRQDQG
jgi:nitrite reductase (NO-forming)